MNRLTHLNKTGFADRKKRPPASLRLCALGVLLALQWVPIGAQDAGGVSLSAISNMTVEQRSYGDRAGSVSLRWTNGSRYDSLELFMGDQLIAELDGELNGYTAENIPLGVHDFGLQGRSGDLVSDRMTVSFNVRGSTPLAEPVAEVFCVYFPEGGGTIEVTWSPGADNWSSGILQIGDGKNLEIASGADSIRVEGVGPEVPEFAIYFMNAEGYYSARIVPLCALRSPLFRRGDCNSDGGVNISDAIFQLNHIYLGRERWYCDDACDANDDGRANLADVVLIIGYVFFGQIEPIGMERICRADETEDFLGGICECPF